MATEPPPTGGPLQPEFFAVMGVLAFGALVGLLMILFFYRVISSSAKAGSKSFRHRKQTPGRKRAAGSHTIYTRDNADKANTPTVVSLDPPTPANPPAKSPNEPKPEAEASNPPKAPLD
ncbi:MAG: hypothetical protein AAF747_04430 [Planctomycetota bacterium]